MTPASQGHVGRLVCLLTGRRRYSSPLDTMAAIRFTETNDNSFERERGHCRERMSPRRQQGPESCHYQRKWRRESSRKKRSELEEEEERARRRRLLSSDDDKMKPRTRRPPQRPPARGRRRDRGARRSNDACPWSPERSTIPCPKRKRELKIRNMARASARGRRRPR